MKRRRTAYDLSVAGKASGVFPLTQSQSPGDGDVSITRVRLPAQFDMSGRLEVQVYDEMHLNPIVKPILDPDNGTPNDLHGVTGNKHNVVDNDIATVANFTSTVTYTDPSTLKGVKAWVVAPGGTTSTFDQVVVNGVQNAILTPLATIVSTGFNTSLTQTPVFNASIDNNTIYESYQFDFTWAPVETAETYIANGVSPQGTIASPTAGGDPVSHLYDGQRYYSGNDTWFATLSGVATSANPYVITYTPSSTQVVTGMKLWASTGDPNSDDGRFPQTVRAIGVDSGGNETVIGQSVVTYSNKTGNSATSANSLHDFTFNPSKVAYASYKFEMYNLYKDIASGGYFMKLGELNLTGVDLTARDGAVAEFYLDGFEGASPLAAAEEPTGTLFQTNLDLGATYTLSGGVYSGDARSGLAALNDSFSSPNLARNAIKDLFMKAFYATSTVNNRIVELTGTVTSEANTWGCELIIEVLAAGTASVTLAIDGTNVGLARYFDTPGLYRLNEWTAPYIYLPPGSYTLVTKSNVGKIGLLSHVSLDGSRPTLTFGDTATLTMAGFRATLQMNTLLQRRMRFPYNEGVLLRNGQARGNVYLNDVQLIHLYLEPSVTNHVSSHLSSGNLSMAEDTLIARTFYVADFQDDYYFSFVQEADDLTNSSTLTSNRSSAMQFTVYLQIYDMLTQTFSTKVAVIPDGLFADVRMVVQS